MTVEHRFESREALAEALATEVAAALAEGIERRGAASLVVSGGSTPVPFFRALRVHEIPWERVTITLADDRWVPPQHERSNERLVRRELRVGPAATARFVGLVGREPTPHAGVAGAEARLADIPRPFDVVILGMGTDGHTASLFPDAPETPRALDAESNATCTAVTPGGELEPRISLTLSALVDSGRLFLHITGEDKWRVYREAATGAHPLPVGRVLNRSGDRRAVYWAP